MNIVTYLQELESLILEHTKPPVTATLRQKLQLALEQAEAHASAVERQEKTLATQAGTIDRLLKENQALIAEKAQRDADPFVEHNGMLFKRKSDGTYHLAAYCTACRIPLGVGNANKNLTCSKCGFISVYTGFHVQDLIDELMP